MHHQAPTPPPPTTAKPPLSWRTIGIVAGAIATFVALIGIAAAVSPTEPATTTTAPPTTTSPPSTTAPPPTYKPFEQVDPRTSLYFITLEETDLAQTQGQERLYNLGLGVCRNLDRQHTIEQELTGLIDDARLTPDDAGALVGAAVTDMCPQHGPTVERYLAEAQ